MFQPENHPGSLNTLWRRCAYHPPTSVQDWLVPLPSLDPRHLARLAHGFIGCNLAYDLADEFYFLIQHPDFDIAPNLPAIELLSMLDFVRQDPVVVAGLVAPTAQAAVTARAAGDAWREINLWLWREVIVRTLTPAQQRPQYTPAYFYASRLFRGSQTVPQSGSLSAGCQRRYASSVRAFQVWWDDASGRLIDFLEAGGLAHWAVVNSRLAAILGWVLCPTPPQQVQGDWVAPQACGCPLEELLRCKNQQWTQC